MSDSTVPATTEETVAPETKPTHIFGSGTVFGSGSGFAGFTGVPKPEKTEEAGADDEADADNPEEECKAEFAPIVQLEEVETTTGEEDEDPLLELKCKLYRFDNDNNEWKERGIGQVKLLQHKENKKVRLLMRQEKTLKIRANHIVMPGVKLQEHSGNDKAWVWSTVDFADEKQSVEMFCIRFGTVEKAQEFKKKFEEAQEINVGLFGPSEVVKDEVKEEADKLADEIKEKVAVSEEPKEKEEAA